MSSRTSDSLLSHAIAGTIGGVAGIYSGSPFDVIKLRLQVASGAAPSAVSVARSLWAAEGVRGFFRGAWTVSLGQGPVNFVVFATYAQALRALDDTAGVSGSGSSGAAVPPPLSRVAMAGVCSGFFQALVLAPFEFVKVQQQSAGRGDASSLTATARAIHAACGARGLSRGVFATLVRDAPTFGLYFGSYEYVKRAGSASLGVPTHEQPPGGVLLVAGALAGALSWAVSLPADVVKSTIQAAPLTTPRRELRYHTVVARVWREGGAAAFFRGFFPCVLRSLPVNAVTFFVYESVLDML